MSGPRGQSLSLSRVLPASVDRVFDACTRAELLAEWLVCSANGSARATNDLRIGGAFRVEMIDDQGAIGDAYGRYVEIAPPHRLVFSWSSDRAGVRDSLVIIELREVTGGTELTLSQTLDPSTDEGRQHVRGWTASLTHLRRTLGGKGGAH